MRPVTQSVWRRRVVSQRQPPTQLLLVLKQLLAVRSLNDAAYGGLGAQRCLLTTVVLADGRRWRGMGGRRRLWSFDHAGVVFAPGSNASNERVASLHKCVLTLCRQRERLYRHAADDDSVVFDPAAPVRLGSPTVADALLTRCYARVWAAQIEDVDLGRVLKEFLVSFARAERIERADAVVASPALLRLPLRRRPRRGATGGGWFDAVMTSLASGRSPPCRSPRDAPPTPPPPSSFAIRCARRRHCFFGVVMSRCSCGRWSCRTTSRGRRLRSTPRSAPFASPIWR